MVFQQDLLGGGTGACDALGRGWGCGDGMWLREKEAMVLVRSLCKCEDVGM